MTAIIQTQLLTKHFGTFTVVDKLSISVEPGEIYGFLGPNGAGKTTTILMLLGIIPPSSGHIEIFGTPIQRNDQFKKQIGVALENLSFYDEMTAMEYLRFFGQIYDVADTDIRALHLLERLQLDRWRDGVIGSFSTGMQRKLSLARTLLHKPSLLILDEPTSGLDPFSIVQVRELLLEANESGTTIIISSHHLSEIEQTANRIGIISAGHLVAEDTVTNLLQKMEASKLCVVVKLAEISNDLVSKLNELPFIEQITQDKNILTIFPRNKTDIRLELSRFLLEQGALIVEMQMRNSTLEDAFISLTSGIHHK